MVSLSNHLLRQDTLSQGTVSQMVGPLGLLMKVRQLSQVCILPLTALHQVTVSNHLRIMVVDITNHLHIQLKVMGLLPLHLLLVRLRLLRHLLLSQLLHPKRHPSLCFASFLVISLSLFLSNCF